MASRDKEKYYWLKLDDDFFKRDDMRILETMKNGHLYVLLYIKLMLSSVKHCGRLMLTDSVPYNAELISSLMNINIDIVNGALKAYRGLGLIELQDGNTLFIPEVEESLDFETYGAKRKREYREKCLSPVSTARQLPAPCSTDRAPPPSEHSDTGHPTLEEVEKYVDERHSLVSPERFYNYYEARGWSLNGKPIQSWKALMYSWEEKAGFKEAEETHPLPDSIRIKRTN